jgi:hypothetical protein
VSGEGAGAGADWDTDGVLAGALAVLAPPPQSQTQAEVLSEIQSLEESPTHALTFDSNGSLRAAYRGPLRRQHKRGGQLAEELAEEARQELRRATVARLRAAGEAEHKCKVAVQKAEQQCAGARESLAGAERKLQSLQCEVDVLRGALEALGCPPQQPKAKAGAGGGGGGGGGGDAGEPAVNQRAVGEPSEPSEPSEPAVNHSVGGLVAQLAKHEATQRRLTQDRRSYEESGRRCQRLLMDYEAKREAAAAGRAAAQAEVDGLALTDWEQEEQAAEERRAQLHQEERRAQVGGTLTAL